MSNRLLSDGELYRAIRLDLLRRKSPVARGEKVVIFNSARGAAPA
jgi:hypothetical protein